MDKEWYTKKHYVLKAESGKYSLTGFPVKILYKGTIKIIKENPRLTFLLLILDLGIGILTSFFVGNILGFVISIFLMIVERWIIPYFLPRESHNIMNER